MLSRRVQDYVSTVVKSSDLAVCYVAKRSRSLWSLHAIALHIMARGLVISIVFVVSLVMGSKACADTAHDGCCYQLGECTSNDACTRLTASYLVALGFSRSPSDSHTTCAAQTNCLFYTPTTSCDTIGRGQIPCNDGGYCQRIFDQAIAAAIARG